MNTGLLFTRVFFGILSIFFMVLYMVERPSASNYHDAIYGVGLGLALIASLIGIDIAFRKFNLRSFNIAIIGLFFGYLMGMALDIIFNVVLDIAGVPYSAHDETLDLVRVILFLFGTYIGTILTLRSSEELYISIPFVKFSPTEKKKKDLIIDGSLLSDARILDLCNTGILDQHIVIPRFIVKELYATIEGGTQNEKSRARRALDTLKQMEETDSLSIRFNDTDFPEAKEIQGKLVRLARLMDANLLTSDINKVEMSSIEGIKVINLHSLSNSLKPLMDTGEIITIKVQRVGKEPKQGVGYLDDGTMVVINGAGDKIGETIDAHVLSVKHTSSGRMIFCNAHEEEA